MSATEQIVFFSTRCGQYAKVDAWIAVAGAFQDVFMLLTTGVLINL